MVSGSRKQPPRPLLSTDASQHFFFTSRPPLLREGGEIAVLNTTYQKRSCHLVQVPTTATDLGSLSEVQSVSRELVTVEVFHDKKIGMSRRDPPGELRSGLAFSKQLSPIVVYLYIYTNRFGGLPADS